MDTRGTRLTRRQFLTGLTATTLYALLGRRAGAESERVGFDLGCFAERLPWRNGPNSPNFCPEPGIGQRHVCLQGGSAHEMDLQPRLAPGVVYGPLWLFLAAESSRGAHVSVEMIVGFPDAGEWVGRVAARDERWIGSSPDALSFDLMYRNCGWLQLGSPEASMVDNTRGPSLRISTRHGETTRLYGDWRPGKSGVAFVVKQAWPEIVVAGDSLAVGGGDVDGDGIPRREDLDDYRLAYPHLLQLGRVGILGAGGVSIKEALETGTIAQACQTAAALLVIQFGNQGHKVFNPSSGPLVPIDQFAECLRSAISSGVESGKKVLAVTPARGRDSPQAWWFSCARAGTYSQRVKEVAAEFPQSEVRAVDIYTGGRPEHVQGDCYLHQTPEGYRFIAERLRRAVFEAGWHVSSRS